MNRLDPIRLRLLPVLLLALTACAAGSDDGTGPQLSGETCTAVGAAAGFYTGRLYDTHVHADLASAPAALDCLARRHNVTPMVLFAGQTGGTNAGNRVKSWMSPYAPRFVPFVHLDPKSPSDVSAAELDRALSATPQIAGIGEWALYRAPWLGTRFSDAPWAEVFDWAAAKGMWVMVHPRTDQIADLEAILASHPQTKVLLHTAWNVEDIPRLLTTYPNLWFTLDLASLISVPMNGGGVDVLLADPQTRDGFIPRYDAERDAILAESYQRWSPTVLAAPTRVMWGTDAHLGWHYEPEVYDRLMDFARRWIAMLPADVRDGYAHGNADRLLGAGRAF